MHIGWDVIKTSLGLLLLALMLMHGDAHGTFPSIVFDGAGSAAS